MAQAFASRIIAAPVEAVWPVLRAFDGLEGWGLGVTGCHIEDGRAPDDVGCVRAFHLADGTLVRERLLALDDSRYRLSYNFETPAFPVRNYRAHLELIPVTDGDATYIRWWATFDEAPEDAGRYAALIPDQVFARALAHLADRIPGDEAMAGPRWQGLRPAKVFCSVPLRAPAAAVWDRMRDFAGMDGWHPEIRDMVMLAGDASSRVSAVRDFIFGEGRLWEQLTLLDDPRMEFRYRILKSEMAWMNYHAGARLYPVSCDDTTLAVWTADWIAAPTDDLELIPNVHHNVFELALKTLEAGLTGQAA